MINLPECIVLPPRVSKIFQIRKIDKFDTDISDLSIVCFDQDESYQKFYFKHLMYSSMINFLFYTVLPPGTSETDQTHKFDDFLKSDTVISNDTVQFFGRNKSCQKLCYKQL